MKKMSNQDTNTIRKLYNDAEETWPSNDAWHTYTHEFISRNVQSYLSKLTSDDTVLNAGSGDTIYESKATIYDVDIAESKLKKSLHPVVANIESLPFIDGFFNCIICVGSVINYCDIYAAILEFSRVLDSGGTLCIEYERSQSAEFVFSKHYNENVFPFFYNYNNQQHKLWLYSDEYVTKFLRQSNFVIEKKTYFHGISSVLAKIIKSESKASRYARYDYLFPWFMRYYAHNCIIWAHKI